MTSHRVFISYSRLDVDWARSFAQALKEKGVSVWFDEFEISPGESLSGAIEAGLRDSDVFVVVIDPEHPSRPALYFELGAAIGLRKRVVAIVPKEIEQARLPAELRVRKYLLKESPQATAQELSQALLAA